MRNKNIFHFFCVISFFGTAFLLTSCYSVSKAEKSGYDAFRESRPVSILILPPINNSVEIDAPNIILASAVKPLAESGYYVVPVTVSQQMFMQNGIQTAFDAHTVNYSKLREIFGADAALYLTINQFGTSFQLIRSVVQVSVSARLVDLKNGTTIWLDDIYYEEEPSQSNTNPGGSLAVQLIAAVASAVVDQVVNTLSNAPYTVGSNAMGIFLNAEQSKSILYGPYNPQYQTD